MIRSMKGTVHIGPYRLRRPIATTPVSEVWAAVHTPTQRAVALKLMTPDATRDPRRLKAFRAELRATAGLSNPNVVHLYETGHVDEVAARASKGRLRTGAPYMVLELCSGGTLDEIKRPFRWSELKAVLVALLDGLAHLHARGFVHRAVRPSVVLLNGIEDERQGVKLAGLGLAHALDALLLQGDFPGMGEALHYMAPEQLRRRWRDLGPWTDLYSLGCLAWHLASNQRPFRALKGHELARAHLQDVLPPLRPRGPVPEGFERWLKRLTTKSHERRFQRAADATWALIRLGDVREDLPPQQPDALVVALEDEHRPIRHQRSGQFNIHELRAQLEETEALARFSTVPELTEGELTVFDGTLSPDMPPVPASWHDAKHEYRWTQPPGTGLGLFDLRPLAMVDRLEERSSLWTTFREVVQTRSARLVRVTGSAGIGKSHLVRWLTERAHELGAATILRASHARNEAPGTSVRRMFQNHLRLAKLDRSQARARIQDFLFTRNVRQADEIEALTELLYPSTRVDAGTRRVSGVEERHAVVRRFFRLLTLERPLIVWLEDAHWGNDALGLAYSVLENQRYAPMPVLFVLTTRDETLAERPVERALLEDIDRLAGADPMELGTLPERDQQRLVEQVMGLEEGIARQVVERTSGNPLLAVEIVRDWVHRGALEPSSRGFTLAPGEDLAIPDDLHAVWMRRVERVLRGLPLEAEAFIEAAAVLGLEVDEEEWREVTDHPDGFDNPQYVEKGGMAFFPGRARIRAKLADRLLDYRLAEETITGWSFAHGMIREAVLRWGRESGREYRHHRAAASMLQRRFRNGQRDVAERLGKHLEAAGRLEEAVDPLMVGVEERRTTLGVQPALSLLQQCEDLMERLRLPPSDPRWGALWNMRASLAFMRGDHDEAERWSRQARLAASDNDWSRWKAVMHEALYRQAQIEIRRGQLVGAEALFRQLRGATVESEDRRMHALALHGLAAVDRERGNHGAALVALGEARRAFEVAEDPIGIADCWEDMATLDLQAGDLDSAEALYKRALDVFERHHERQRVGTSVYGLAEVARRRGDVGDAESGYRHALSIFESVDSVQTVLARLALAVLHLQRGDFGEATLLAEEARNALAREGRRPMQGSAEVILSAAAAGRKDWPTFRDHLERASALRKATAFCGRDAAWAAHKAGDLALQAEQVDAAKDAYRFAWWQYRGLGDTVAMERLQQLVGAPAAT